MRKLHPRIGILALLLSASAAASPALPRLDAGVGAGLPVTSKAGYDSLAHGALMASVNLDWLLDSPFFPRIGFSYGTVSASAFSAHLDNYMGWEAWNADLLAGLRLPLGKAFLRGAELDLLAGGGLSVARYRGTPLVFAYPRARIEGALLLGATGGGIRPQLRLPVEILFRGDLLTLQPSLMLSAYVGPVKKKAAP